MPTTSSPPTLADALREAVRASGLSYSRLAQLAKLNSGTVSHFMTGDRDMTLGVASRLCAALGYGLTKVGAAVAEPLATPPTTNRDPKSRSPASAVKRGRGRRVDLERSRTDGREDAEQTGTAPGAEADSRGPSTQERRANNRPTGAENGRQKGTRKR